MSVSVGLCTAIASQVGELFSCVEHGDYVRIRTPFLYPDGDVIDVFARGNFPGLELSDLGDTFRWLSMQTASDRRTKKQRQIIQDVCVTHGVEFFDGMFLLRVGSVNDLAASVIRVAQAILRVADLWFTFRVRAFEAVTDEVEELLREKQIDFERGERFVGRSGKTWSVDFHTRTSRRSALVEVLSTSSRAASQGIVDHVVATWFDLNILAAGREPLKFVSLFDDTEDVWSPEDFRRVEPLSTLTYWSRPDDFLVELVA
jgi:hypothetical protein